MTTCANCQVTRLSTVRLCSLHAAAEEMRDLLARYVVKHTPDDGPPCDGNLCREARALLARVRPVERSRLEGNADRRDYGTALQSEGNT